MNGFGLAVWDTSVLKDLWLFHNFNKFHFYSLRGGFPLSFILTHCINMNHNHNIHIFFYYE